MKLGVYNGANGEEQRIPSIYAKATEKKKRKTLLPPLKVSPKEPFHGVGDNDVFLISCNQNVRAGASQSSRFNLQASRATARGTLPCVANNNAESATFNVADKTIAVRRRRK